ncbi:MAG: hypothetical protein Kow0077_26280 [Anaerolineae bacterium]
MSAVTIDNDLVHYEVLGRGRPVILLHGWLNSWRYWVPSMQHLSLKYRTYALDLWGFGDSSKNPAKYSLEAYVQQLSGFMDKMGIPKAALIGHSLGAAVAAHYALRYPQQVARLMAISPPVFEESPIPRPEEPDPAPARPDEPTRMARPAGLDQRIRQSVENAPPPTASPSAPTTMNRSQDLEQRLKESLARHLGGNQTGGKPLSEVNSPTRPLNAHDLPGVPEVSNPDANVLREKLAGVTAQELLAKHLEHDAPDYERLYLESGKTDPAALTSSAASFDRVDLAYDLRQLATPVLMLHGQLDEFLPAPSEALIQYVQGGRNGLRCEVLPTMGHFPMLSDPTSFQRLITDFLDVRDLADLVMYKERWVRKVR